MIPTIAGIPLLNAFEFNEVISQMRLMTITFLNRDGEVGAVAVGGGEGKIMAIWVDWAEEAETPAQQFERGYADSRFFRGIHP